MENSHLFKSGLKTMGPVQSLPQKIQPQDMSSLETQRQGQRSLSKSAFKGLRLFCEGYIRLSLGTGTPYVQVKTVEVMLKFLLMELEVLFRHTQDHVSHQD